MKLYKYFGIIFPIIMSLILLVSCALRTQVLTVKDQKKIMRQADESNCFTNDKIDNSYKSFLKGEASAIDKGGKSYYIRDCCLNYEKEKDTIKYALFDMTGDGFDELHILTEGAYMILTINDNSLVTWYDADYHSRPLNNRAILEKVESTGIHYNYTILNEKGDITFSCSFSEPYCNDLPFIINHGGNEIKLSEKEWRKFTEPFFNVDSDKIRWRCISELIFQK